MTAVYSIVEAVDGNKFQLTTDVIDANDEPVIEWQAIVLIDEIPEVERFSIDPVPAK